MMKSDEKWENADIFSEIKTGENEVQYLLNVPGKAISLGPLSFSFKETQVCPMDESIQQNSFYI